MHIEIAERLRPFSHLPGTYAMLPGSTLRLQIFPALIRLDDLANTLPVHLASITFDLKGPLEDFTIVQDLEKGLIRVWGKSKDGFFRYRLAALADKDGLLMSMEKTPSEGVKCSSQGSWQLEGGSPARPGDQLVMAPKTLGIHVGDLFSMQSIDRLSLGNHQSQDWEIVNRREDLAQIFPIWHRLGQLVADPKKPHENGTAALLEECRQAIDSHSPETILPAFRRLYLSGFDRGLSPRLHDDEYHGITGSFDSEIDSSSLTLLSEGSRLIRSLFILEDPASIVLLPALPPEFHCGRMIQVVCGRKGELSVEWTKKMLRRLIFKASHSQQLSFAFCRGERSCRIRTSSTDRGFYYLNRQAIDVVAGESYWFDNFEK